jgi:hypothetical protein
MQWAQRATDAGTDANEPSAAAAPTGTPLSTSVPGNITIEAHGAEDLSAAAPAFVPASAPQMAQNAAQITDSNDPGLYPAFGAELAPPDMISQG